MLLAVLAGLAALTGTGKAQASYGDDELIRGFVLTVFGAEVRETLADDVAAARVKKFAGPVHYALVSSAVIDWRRSVRDYVARLSAVVTNLTLTEVETPELAQMTIYLVDRSDYVATIRSTVWQGVQTGFLERNACSAVIAARSSGIDKASVYLVADEGFLTLSHCMVEEIAQSLGPANDSDQLTFSIFNDQSNLNTLGLFDWFILNMLYDERIRPGMSESEARAVLSDVIADVRKRLPAVIATSATAGHDSARQ